MITKTHELEHENASLREQNALLSKQLARVSRDYEFLVERFRARMAKIFGRSAERLHPDQLRMAFAELEEIAAEEAPQAVLPQACEAPDAEDAERAPKKRRRGAKTLPKELERVRVLEDLDEADKICNDCTEPMTKIGEDVREELEYVPASLFIKEHVRPKYACAHCHTGVHSAAPEPQVIAKGLAGPGLLAHVLVAKYVDHLPLHRQEAQFARQGVELSRSTMCDWIGGIVERLKLLAPHLKAEVLSSALIHADDTPLTCLQNSERGGKLKAALWVYRGNRATLFDLRADRSRDGPLSMLKEWSGYMVRDAYAGYDELDRTGRVIGVGCNAHARRKFFEALPKAPEDCSWMLARFQMLYRIDAKARADGLDFDALLHVRQERMKPIVEEMRAKLAEMEPRALPKSLFGDAVGYMRRQWVELTRFLEDGRLPLDNNAAERAIRGVAVGRKNWLFAGSFAGGERAALIYSFVETCKQNGVEPFAYFRDVLEHLPRTAMDQLASLTPWAWKAERQATT